jgi:hypothetical protein
MAAPFCQSPAAQDGAGGAKAQALRASSAMNRDRQSERSARAPRGARGSDARHNPEKLRENQQRLGVDAQHKTDAMKKGRRGTFP